MTAHSALISAEELLPLLNTHAFVLLDVRSNLINPKAGYEAYENSHLPGARFTDFEADVSGCRSGTNGRHPLPDSSRFCVNMRRLGLNATSNVVVYDDGSLSFAARLWFTLRWVGFENVRVLNGGFSYWQANNYPLQTEIPDWEPGTYRAQPPLERVFDDDFVEHNLKENGPYILVDARSHERYLGHNETIDPIAGHIPGAINHPGTLNIGANGLMKSNQELVSEFSQLLKSRSPENVINTCGSGVTACTNHLAMTAAGLDPAGVYIGSWSEWIADEGRPISTSDEQ